MFILPSRTWGLRDLLKAAAARGRHVGKPHGSYIGEQAELRKAISLCDFCRSKFNAKRHQYHKSAKYPQIRGDCDACNNFSERLSLFIPVENAAVIGEKARR